MLNLSLSVLHVAAARLWRKNQLPHVTHLETQIILLPGPFCKVEYMLICQLDFRMSIKFMHMTLYKINIEHRKNVD